MRFFFIGQLVASGNWSLVFVEKRGEVGYC